MTSGRRSVAEITYLTVAIDAVIPNPWNPNAMTDEMFGKAIESIHRFGFVDPVTCRELGDGVEFQIIDGEHRWKAAKSHSGRCDDKRHYGMLSLPIISVGAISDEIAKQLTIVLNETRGESDPRKLGAIITDLLISEPLPVLAAVLPFSPDRLAELAELPKVDWSRGPHGASGGGGAKWVERIYRLPPEVAKTLDRAIAEAHGDSDWEAIQTIAEHYLADA